MDLLGHYLQDRQQKIRKTTDGIRSEIYEQLDCGEEISDERLGQIIDEKIRQKQDIQLALEERESIHREIFAAIRGLDVLQELLEDDSITEIMVNGTQDIFLERCGRLERCSKHFENKARLSDVAQRNSLNTDFFPLLLFSIRAGLLTDWLFQTVCRFENRHIHVQKPEYRWLYNMFSVQW